MCHVAVDVLGAYPADVLVLEVVLLRYGPGKGAARGGFVSAQGR